MKKGLMITALLGSILCLHVLQVKALFRRKKAVSEELMSIADLTEKLEDFAKNSSDGVKEADKAKEIIRKTGKMDHEIRDEVKKYISMQVGLKKAGVRFQRGFKWEDVRGHQKYRDMRRKLEPLKKKFLEAYQERSEGQEILNREKTAAKNKGRHYKIHEQNIIKIEKRFNRERQKKEDAIKKEIKDAITYDINSIINKIKHKGEGKPIEARASGGS